MKNLYCCLFLLLLSFHIPIKSENVDFESNPALKEIDYAIKTGNYKTLSKYFNSTVEIILPNIDGSFSKAQAEMIMKDFFEQNAPKKFKVNYIGASPKNLQTVIGVYESENTTFSMYLLLKPINDTLLIQKLQFELE